MQREDKTHFETGLHYIIGTWTLVELAVSHGFAGRRTADRVDQMEDSIINMFYRGKKVGVDDVEDFLYKFVEERLNTEAEDGSVEEIADEIIDLFDCCQSGDFSRVDELRQLYLKKHPPDRPPPAPQRMELDSDEDDEEGSDEEDSDGEGEAGEGEKPQSEERGPRKKEVDEEGWEVVSNRRGRKGK